MSRALVLSGGGSRGAYECGAWEALRTLGIRFDAVYGTSIGAINAALIAQGDIETAKHIWQTININQVAVREDGEDINVSHMLTKKRDMVPFLVGNMKNLRLDVTPLRELMEASIDEDTVRASGMKFGIMLTNMPQMTGFPVRLEDIPQGMLIDYLLASAACFPVFPVSKINGKRYIDGGFVDNMPIGMAIEDGAGEIIAVDIHPQPVHPEYAAMPFMRLIHPMRDLGNFLSFDRETLDRSRKLGFLDTAKAYGEFDGILYTYHKFDGRNMIADAGKYLHSVAVFDARANEKKDENTLIAALTSETPGYRLSWKECMIRGLELCAETMDFRQDRIYSMEKQTKLLLDFVRGCDLTSIEHLNEADKRFPGSLMAYIYRSSVQDEGFITDNIKKLADHPKETAAALYLLNCEK